MCMVLLLAQYSGGKCIFHDKIEIEVLAISLRHSRENRNPEEHLSLNNPGLCRGDDLFRVS